MNNLTERFAAVADNMQNDISDTDLVQIQKYMARALALLQELEQLEAATKTASEEYRRITEEHLPMVMKKLGMSNFKLADGTVLEIKDDVYAKIKEENEAAAYHWLRTNGYGDTIKNVVQVSFAAGEDAKALKLVDKIEHDKELKGLEPEHKQTVHSSTLKSLVKECLENGVNLPLDIFGVFQRAVAKIKKPKL